VEESCKTAQKTAKFLPWRKQDHGLTQGGERSANKYRIDYEQQAITQSKVSEVISVPNFGELKRQLLLVLSITRYTVIMSETLKYRAKM
jgi:hypothetical protein